MRTGRPGPAALECAIDVWGKSAAVDRVGAAAASGAEDRHVGDPPRRKAPRRGEAADDRLRRRRAGCRRGSHRAVGDAASAGARLSPRPRRARQPRSVERHAAARPRSVGRGRRRAGGRHASPHPIPPMGHRSRACDRSRRRRSEGARPAAQARRRADRRRQADPPSAACGIAGAQRQAAVAQGRNAGAPGRMAQAPGKT